MAFTNLENILKMVADGRAEEAVPLLESFIEHFPSYAPAQVVLARTHESMGHWREALHRWQTARYMVPNSPAVEAGMQRTILALAAPDEAAIPSTGWARPIPSGATSKTNDRAWTSVGKVLEAASSGGSPEPSGAAGFDDLDRLIGELESARIIPDPDLDAFPAPDLDVEIEDVVSETLARIFAAQSQYEEAAQVYDKLAEQQPERAAEFTDKARELRLNH